MPIDYSRKPWMVSDRGVRDQAIDYARKHGLKLRMEAELMDTAPLLAAVEEHYANHRGQEVTGALLYDADTAEPIGAATPEQVEASSQAAERDGGAGVIRIATDGTPVADGTWGADQPGVRRVYTDSPSVLP